MSDSGKALTIIVGVLIMATVGLSQDAFADPITLIYSTFIDSFSVAGEDITPTGVAFSSDGTKMFVSGNTGDAVHEYILSSSFDVSTAVFVDSFSVAGQETFPQGLAFSSDGTKMFVVGTIGDDINEYTLSSSFDVSTAVFVDSFSVAEDASPNGVAFSSDGTQMFVVGSNGNNINEYSLSTPFDVSTAVFVDSFSVGGQDTAPTGVAFSSDGTQMFVSGNTGDDINEYTLTTPFDVSTAVFVDSFSIADEDISPTGVAFSSDGTKMFVVGNEGDDINEYDLTSIETCSPSTSGDWVVDTSCTITSDVIINNGDLIVENNAILTIPFTLDIDFSIQKITIESGSGILIKTGGSIT